jgi:hypothetical protein
VAKDEHITFAQSPTGSVVATILGDIPYCDPFIGYGFIGVPLASESGYGVAITSIMAGGECAASSPPYPPPQPYQLTVDLGNLVGGRYFVAWTYLYPYCCSSIVTQAEFSLESGEIAIFTNSFE